MRYDVVIIGGGLSALVCGIRLQRSGKSVLLVSSGQNAMHFSSGSFGFLGRLPDGSVPDSLIDAVQALPESHPYRKVGTDRLREYAGQTIGFFESAGILLHGDPLHNSLRLTASGATKPAWLAMEDVTLFASGEVPSGGKALVVTLKGFTDFNAPFVASAFSRMGYTCRLEEVEMEEIASLRKNPTEMRSVNIARALEGQHVLDRFISCLRGKLKDEDTVVLPQVFGLKDTSPLAAIRSRIPAHVHFIGTMIPSVPGIRTQMSLKSAFLSAGGTFLSGDTAVRAGFDGSGSVAAIYTSNLGKTPLEAGEFILASGGLWGKGLDAKYDAVIEPLFSLDVDYPGERKQWYDPDFFARQSFTGFGGVTDDAFRAVKGGKTVPNLRVIGAECGGANPLEEGSGAGIAIMSAFMAADSILGSI